MSYLQEHVTISYITSHGNPTRLQSFTLVITHTYAWLYQPLISLHKVIKTAKISVRLSAHYWSKICSSCKKTSLLTTLIKIRTHFWMNFFYKICEINCEQWDNKLVQKQTVRYDWETGSRSVVLVFRLTECKYRDRPVILKPKVLTQRNNGIFRSLKVSSV